MNHISNSIILNNGKALPMLGLGVYLSQDGQEVKNAIRWALETGYRCIDTASFYKNERGVGEAVRESGVARNEIFVTSKVWNSDQGYDETLRAFDKSMDKLGLAYLDLYLVHWPVRGKYKATYKALEAIYKSGRVKSIGVSNFMLPHLQDLLAHCTVVPTVNQIEYHPYLAQPDLIAFCKKHQIVPQAWSPLMQGQVLQIPLLQALAKKYGKTTVQIVLRWNLQKGVATIPKSSKQHRIIDNANIFDFELSTADITQIDALDRGQRVGPDPFTFNF